MQAERMKMEGHLVAIAASTVIGNPRVLMRIVPGLYSARSEQCRG